jgi:hypothetical protein
MDSSHSTNHFVRLVAVRVQSDTPPPHSVQLPTKQALESWPHGWSNGRAIQNFRGMEIGLSKGDPEG